MLPRIVYGKVLASLKQIRTNWEQDRLDHPNTVPYEIDESLRYVIEKHLRDSGTRVDSHTRHQMIGDAFDYLVKQNLIMKSPYGGGHMFPMPEGTKLPTRQEIIKQVQENTKKILELTSGLKNQKF
jgi:hypothetical protein